MRHLALIAFAALAPILELVPSAVSIARAAPDGGNTFELRDSTSTKAAKSARGVRQ